MRSQPVYLNLFTFKFPVTAIASILHRLSGIFLFLLIPYFLILIERLHINSAVLVVQQQNESCNLSKILWWLGLSALTYHLLAGLRHILMDVGCGETKTAARISAYLVIIASIVLSIFIGIRLC